MCTEMDDSDSSGFTYHDESFSGTIVLVRGLPLARVYPHGYISVRVNVERVTVCLHTGKLIRIRPIAADQGIPKRLKLDSGV